MRQSRLLILPTVGLFLFAVGTYASIRFNRQAHTGSHKYFYWSSIRLDAHPLDRRFRLVPCNSNQPDCPSWEPEHIWVEPGVLARVCVTSAFPAFLLGLFITRNLGRVGINEITTFMISMPVLIFAWYYLVSWTIGRFINRRRKHRLAGAGGLGF
jgi:hypothetical protein